MRTARGGNSRAYDENEPARVELVERIRKAIAERQSTILTGADGLGQVASVRHAAAAMGDWRLLVANGNWLTGGYLSGFHELIDQELAWAETRAPDLLARHEQTLKRVLPTRPSAAYRIPKDLTNSTSREERTRFYHSEYQNKLLVGLAEFLLDVLCVHGSRILLVIEGAQHLSPTSKSLIDVLARRKESRERLRFVFIDEDAAHFDPEAETIQFGGYSLEELDGQPELAPLSRVQRTLIHRLSRGNLRLARTLSHCLMHGVSATDNLSVESTVDFYLATLSVSERAQLAVSHVRRGFSGDLISQRSAATIDPAIVDAENARSHQHALEQFRRGEGPLVLGHVLAIRDTRQRIEGLVEPCDILMGIGFYDTWFAFFAPMFCDPALRAYGDGGSPVNGLLINAAFVLYAMGNARVSAPFLEDFLARFPRSRFVPTALYAQSMTYGRYQVPVDLERAEAYAKRNLTLIDETFRDHEKYAYIKVFAENAYAYIKSRQGKFEEALEYCERGNALILESYGETGYRLHRSILIYNTSQIYEIIGDFTRAEARLREAIACDPYYAEYHNDLGNLLSRIDGRELEALEAYGQAIALSPPYYEAHLNRGILRAQFGQVADALCDFARTLEIKPQEWRAMREIGNAKLQRGELAAALEAYTHALTYENGDADLHANVGLARSESGDSDIAIHHYLAAIRLRPAHAAAHNNLAAELFERGRLDDALHHARLAAEHGEDPDFTANLEAIEACNAEREFR